jgi:hypothetical protein
MGHRLSGPVTPSCGLVGDGLIDISAGAWQAETTRPVGFE